MAQQSDRRDREGPSGGGCPACLRINESLDLETVPQSVLDSARSLTSTRYGVVLLWDGTPRPVDFAAFSGRDD